MNRFGRETMSSKSLKLYHHLLTLFEDIHVLPYLWNLNNNNGLLNRTLFNTHIRQRNLDQKKVSNLLLIVDKIMRNNGIMEYLSVNVPQIGVALNSYFQDPRRPDLNLVVWYLFRQYY
jgi:hypothetical protein